jgi:APA family basic amino acid/polyamine antiporter
VPGLRVRPPGQAFPKAGGPYAYTQEAFGRTAGFMVAWSYWISLWVGNAAIATGRSAICPSSSRPIAKVPGLHGLVTVALVWLLTAINCYGARRPAGCRW